MNFYPEIPRKSNRIYKYLVKLGIPINKEEQNSVYWSYKTKDIETKASINRGGNDVSKSKVDECFKQAFGYSLGLNPETHKGTCLKKSETQAVHDGVIVKCPTKREDGYVYEYIIDTRVSRTEVRDMRVFYCFSPGLVIYKYRDIENAFLHNSTRAEAIIPEFEFSYEEIENINKFCELFGMEFCELDVLRHSDGRIFIVDVNNVAGAGVFSKLEKSHREIAVKIYMDQIKEINTILEA
jgi:hypothetical protein